MSFNQYMITPILQSKYQPNFKANLNSPKLQYSAEDFFIKIKGYGKNKPWADEIIKTADSAVNMMRKNRNFENIWLRNSSFFNINSMWCIGWKINVLAY